MRHPDGSSSEFLIRNIKENKARPDLPHRSWLPAGTIPRSQNYANFSLALNLPGILFPLTDLICKSDARERSDATLAVWDYTKKYSLLVYQKHLRIWKEILKDSKRGCWMTVVKRAGRARDRPARPPAYPVSPSADQSSSFVCWGAHKLDN